MSATYIDCLSTRIRLGNSTPAEDALADAAPDLLAACENALAYLEANRPKGNIRENFSAINAHENGTIKPLRAAIARARQS